MSVSHYEDDAPGADHEKRQVGDHVPEVGDAKQRARVCKQVVDGILRDRCDEQEHHDNGQSQRREDRDVARNQMPIFASRSANSLAMRSATG